MRHLLFRLSLAATPLLFLPSLVGAQGTGAPAAGSPAPKPCATPEHRQFDFWVGDWNVVDPKGEPAGTNDVKSVFGGCVVMENWVGAGGETGSSFNIYNAPARKWHQTWVDSHGQVLLLDGQFREGKMVLEGRREGASGGTVVDRISWERINGDPNRVRQLWQASRDGGKTWAVVFEGTYVRKS